MTPRTLCRISVIAGLLAGPLAAAPAFSQDTSGGSSSSGGAPSGAAGGKLSGTYPNPGLAAACSDLSNAAASCATDATNASNLSSGSVPAARLPNPTSSTLGGVESKAAVSHQFLNTISTSGVPGSAQPACADVSDAAASCATDATNASNISAGTLPNARLSAVPNSALANPSVTVGGATCTLGSSCTPAASGAMTLISTQTASSSASLQWTGLGSAYNTYFLDCALVAASNNAVPNLQFGEGGGPTWETASYRWTAFVQNDSPATGSSGSAAGTSMQLAFTQSYTVQANNGHTFGIYIHNVPSTTVRKHYSGTGTYPSSGSGFGVTLLGGTYEGDTGAITAFRVQESTGNISTGQCSLYGLTP